MLTFIQENSDYLKKKEINIYEIVKNISDFNKQLQFVGKMFLGKMDKINLDLSLPEKLKCLVVLKDEAKQYLKGLDNSKINERYKQVLSIPYNSNNTITVNFNQDLEIYKDLDEFIRIKPQDIPFDEHSKIFELVEICPEMGINDEESDKVLECKGSGSTVQEFINAEKWITEVLSNVKEEWSDVQKIAYIDNCIGKKISYTPDFDTEVYDDVSARALWKIIDKGYGVCNGIAQVEQYILKHIGIESEIMCSQYHAFLKIPNIEIPRENGTIVKGDSLIDPTRNSASHKYNAMPTLFLVSYDQIREFDKYGKFDTGWHKVEDETNLDNTIGLEEIALQKIYRSIGLTKEDGVFYVHDMFNESKKIAKQDIILEEKISQQLELLARVQPDFSKFQNSTIAILEAILDHPEMDFEKIEINRVYNKNKENKIPSIYVYCDTGEDNEFFYVAEPGDQKFSYMCKEDFIQNYECYDKDIEKMGGKRPWEECAKKIQKDLSKSSGGLKRTAQDEGDER